MNLLEIQEIVYKHTNIPNICICIRNDSKLVLFLTILEFNSITKKKIIDKIRVKLLHTLPKQYFPDHIEIISSFPLTQHGKIDTKSLEEIYNNVTDDFEKRANNPKDIFIFLLCKYLGMSYVQIEKNSDCNFMELGGNSISAIQLLSEFQDITKIRDTENLTILLFEKVIKECYDHVSNIQISNLKRKQHNVECESSLKNKVQVTDKNENEENNIELQVCWKVDLGACVDSTPAIIENR